MAGGKQWLGQTYVFAHPIQTQGSALFPGDSISHQAYNMAQLKKTALCAVLGAKSN
jgi:hypothetical protein